MSPGRRLIQQRVARARQLLETSDLAVDRVAGAAGFATGLAATASARGDRGVAAGLSAYVPGERATLTGRRIPW